MKTASDPIGPIYVDASALVKIYLPEAESRRVERILEGRSDLLVSDLAVTEVISAAARRRREGSLSREAIHRLYRAMLKDMEANMFQRIDLLSSVFREAERLLLLGETVPLRAADALHIALAAGGGAKAILTFDSRLAAAAGFSGLALL